MRKRVLACLLVLSILAVLAATGSSVSAAAAVKFRLESTTVTAESGATVTVTVTADAIKNVAGLQMALHYEKDLFTYQSGTIVNSSFAGSGMMGLNAPGKISCVWSAGSDGKESVNAAAGTLFTATFTAANVDAEQTGAFTLSIAELFNPSWKKIDAEVSGSVSITVKPMVQDSAVANVESLIDAIGTVVYTEECGARIDAAKAAFTALNAEQQNAVANYDRLSAALREYARLREQQNAQDHAAALQKEIDAFKALPILSKTAATVTVKDEAAISAALSLYGGKSYYIKDQLSKEYEKLKELQNAVGALLKKSEAQIAAQEFRDLNAYVLSVQKEQMPFIDVFYEKLVEALGQYQSLVESNADCAALLAHEYRHLTGLLQEFERLQILNAPDSEEIIKLANAFLLKYARVLSLTAGNLTDADIAEINAAIAEYMAMPNAAKGRLINQYERLNTLIQPGGGETTTIVEVEKPGATQTEYVYVEKEAPPAEVPAVEQKPLSVAGIALGPRVVWFFILFGIAFVCMCASIALYLFGKKKYVRRSEL